MLSGGILVIVAIIFYLFPPKKINGLYGYRTVSSMQSEERWHFAQRFSAVAMLQSGLGMLLISGLLFYVSILESIYNEVSWTVLIVAVILMIVRTELAIKKKFSV